jgi:hypothetical protein
MKSFDMRTQSTLEQLLLQNEAAARFRRAFPTEAEHRAFEFMRSPVSVEDASALLGALLGVFPPVAICIRVFWRAFADSGVVLFLIAIPITVTAFTGYGLGRIVGKIISVAEEKDWITMTVFLTLVGGAWGAVSGFAGGLPIFVVGAFFGGFFGMIVGAVALPLFAVFHRLLNTAGYVDRSRLLPLAVGTSLTISAFILGL